MSIRVDTLEKSLAEWIASAAGCDKLRRAALYFLNTGGKRLRPRLFFAACEDFGYCWKKALPVACALECIHLYSLIHDDLPAMDNDDLRRGWPTVHKKFGEPIAILLGDFFLTLSFEILASSDCNAERKLKIITLFSKRAGGRGMIEGQCIDLYSDSYDKNITFFKKMHRKKTAALFCAALESAAILSSQSDATFRFVRSLALTFGVYYQLQDDVKDRDQDQKEKMKNPFLCLSSIALQTLVDKTTERLENLTSHLNPQGPLHQFIFSFLQTKMKIQL
jgi:geranylgeranyl diphosphate synthase, type II